MTEPVLPDGARVALVHDWLTGMRGGEKVLEVLCELLPAADVFTLIHLPGRVSPAIEDHRIRTSFLQRLPAADRLYRWALPLFPAAVEAFDLRGYDLVISSSHCVAKGARARQDAVTVCYCHTPMRYVWDRFDDYFGAKPAPLRAAIALVAAGLRRWDVRTAPRVRTWIANSTVVRGRIADCYGVAPEAVAVVHPPVDCERFAGADRLPPPDGLASGEYDLVVSALVPYKRVDLAVEAARRAGRSLVVVGDGPELERLHRLAAAAAGTGRVIFAGAVDDARLPAYYAHCRAFVFPGVEDFGITPLEATACGRPVLALRAGGALDTVREGLNGVFFATQDAAALVAALGDPRLDGPWDAAAMRAHARGFGRERFRREMAAGIARAWRAQRGEGGS